MKVIWTQLAREKLRELIRYIADDNPAAAARMSRTIRGSVKKLGIYPNIGRSGRVAGTRELIVTGTPYLIPYHVYQNHIEVITVQQGAQDWPREFHPSGSMDR